MIFRPSTRLLKIVCGFIVAGLFVGCMRIFFPEILSILYLDKLWLIGLMALGFMCFLDFVQRPSNDLFTVDRVLPGSFGLHRQQKIKFELNNHGQRSWNVFFTDGVPQQFTSSKFPLPHESIPGRVAVFEYHVNPIKRGDAEFLPAFVQLQSQYGLLQFCMRLGDYETVQVYPDYSPIMNAAILGMEQSMRYMGAHIVRQKGGGLEFDQLREFRIGDTLKQIDWKASARMDAPISREYQEERDQNVVFLLDHSRRMRSIENDLSYFDHALNAILTSSYIALNKGDAVGIMAFSGKASWLPPVKGKNSIHRILNHLYRAETSTQSSDYVRAAEELLKQQQKRSLVILLTNVRAEDEQDLQKAVRLLEKHHLVLVVALQEDLLSSVDEMRLDNDKAALTYAGVKHYAHNREAMLKKMRAYSLSIIDATYKNLPTKLVSEYLMLKHSGKL